MQYVLIAALVLKLGHSILGDRVLLPLVKLFSRTPPAPSRRPAWRAV